VKRALLTTMALMLSLGVSAVTGAPAQAVPGGDVTVVVQDQTLGPNGAITVMCPAGQRALGGGASPVNPDPATLTARFRTSAPVGASGGVAVDNGIPLGWRTAMSAESGTLGAWRGYVTCSPTTDALMTTVDMIAAVPEANVACPAGRRAVGGGLTTISSSDLTIIGTSGPKDASPFAQAADGSAPTSWQTILSGTTSDARAVAVCASSSDANVRSVMLDVPAMSSAAAATATCPTGQRAVSGGLATASADNAMRIGFAAPVANVGQVPGLTSGAVPQSWTLQGGGFSMALSYRAYVVCVTAPVPPDTTPPDTSITKGPRKKTHAKKATFVFGSEPGATFTCAMDKKPAVACTSPFKVKKLKVGKHKLTVTAKDAAGNVDATPATYKWKVVKKKKRPVASGCTGECRSGAATG